MVGATFARLTERHYRSTPWPPARAVARFVDGDAVFLMLYSELRFRHLHAATTPSMADRAAAWRNYRDLFDVVLSASLNVRLPSGWLWDMVDEFCYQFQAFHAAKARAAAIGGGGAGGEDAATTATPESEADADAWPPLGVLSYLDALADRASLSNDLATPAAAAAFADAHAGSGPGGRGSNVLRGVGYYAHIGGCRVRVLLADYEGALTALGPVNPLSPPAHAYAAAVPGAAVSLFYYAGFAYLALGRYVDAARSLGAAITHVAKVKQLCQRAAGYDAMLKKNEQCAALAALALALAPGAAAALPDAALSAVRDKHGDKLARMARSATDAAYEDLYAYGCPKFVPRVAGVGPDPVPVAAEGDAPPPANAAQAAYRAQLAAFLAGLAERRLLPPLRALLRLYTSASVPKLAALLDASVEDVQSALAQLKASQMLITWPGSGPAANGVPTPCVDIAFEVTSDPATGEQVVTVEPAASGGGAAGNIEALLRNVDEIVRVVRDLQAMAPPAIA